MESIHHGDTELSSLHPLCQNFSEKSPFEKTLQSREKFIIPLIAIKVDVFSV